MIVINNNRRLLVKLRSIFILFWWASGIQSIISYFEFSKQEGSIFNESGYTKWKISQVKKGFKIL